jgi:hypothetical protein
VVVVVVWAIDDVVSSSDAVASDSDSAIISLCEVR